MRPDDRPEDVVELAALAVTGNDAGSAAYFPERPLRDVDFEALVALAERHHVIGALAEAVSTERFPVTNRQHAVVAEHHLRWMTHCVKVERLLLAVADCMEVHGVQTRVLKGAALAHLVYSDPAWRAYGDLDLLVRGEELDRVADIARRELGSVRPFPELRSGFDREFGKDVLVRVGGLEVDLHRTFVTGPFGLTIPLDALFDGSTSFVVCGRELQALESHAMFLHACYNAALGDHPVRWSSLRDMLLVHERCCIDNAQIETLAREWRASAVVRRAAQLAIEILRLGRSHALAPLATMPVRRSESAWLKSYSSSARSYLRPLASLKVIKGIRPRARYTRALVAPSHEYLRARGWTEQSHVRRALTVLRGGSHG